MLLNEALPRLTHPSITVYTSTINTATVFMYRVMKRNQDMS